MMAETETDAALVALNTALAALVDVKLSPAPNQTLVKLLAKRVVQAMRAALAADPAIDVVEDSNGRWVAIRTA